MKTKVVISKSIKRELITFLICFSAAYIMNVIGIVINESPAKELITKLHVVLLVSVVIYMAVSILRVLYYLIVKLWFLNKKF